MKLRVGWISGLVLSLNLVNGFVMNHRSMLEQEESKNEELSRSMKANIQDQESNQSSAKAETRAIFGGREVNPSFKYPFQVSIQDNQGPFCSGTLYRQDIVLTAAHCANRNSKLEEYRVKVHRHNLSKTDEEEMGSTFNVRRIINHPEYNSSHWNDISIWKLETERNERTSVMLDNNNLSTKLDEILTLSGFGMIESGKASDVLLEIEVPVSSFSKCSLAYSKWMKLIPEYQFCAGDIEKGLKDACQGDSGGPLFKNFENGTSTLVGITSLGRGCGLKGYPGIYTKVQNYINWVELTILDL